MCLKFRQKSLENISFNCLILLVFLGAGSIPHAYSQQVTSFGEAKAINRKIYRPIAKTFYCHCEYQSRSIKDCDLFSKRFRKRAKRLEWEHVVPAHSFGQSFREWRDAKSLCKRKNKKPYSGRKCARKMSKKFRIMESDLHNIVPVVGAINALRSNYSFAEGNKEFKELCKNGLKMHQRKVSPPNNRRGDIARIYQYMDSNYPGHGIISSKNKDLFENWSKIDPIDKDECMIYKNKKLNGANNINIYEKSCMKWFK